MSVGLNEPIPRPPFTSATMKTMNQRTLLVLCVSTVAFGLALRHAKANTGSELHRAGAPFMVFPDSAQDHGRSLLLNGVSSQLTTGVSSSSIDELLDTFENQCAPTLPPPPMHPFTIRPLFRWNNDEQGVAVCLYNPGSLNTLQTWFERLRHFSRDHDLSEMGQLRYLRVDRTGNRTRLIAMETRGVVRLKQLLALDEDAPGSDLPRFPRPARSRRILSAQEVGTEPKLTAYRLSGPNGASEFMKRLRDQGFRVQAVDVRQPGKPGKIQATVDTLQPTENTPLSGSNYVVTKAGQAATVLSHVITRNTSLILLGR